MREDRRLKRPVLRATLLPVQERLRPQIDRGQDEVARGYPRHEVAAMGNSWRVAVPAPG